MWTVPDKGEGDNDIQSILFQEYLEVLVAGIDGKDCVLSGLAVTGGADMTPAIAKGAVLSNGVMFAIAAADVTITAADATNPRLDLIVVNSSGALAVRAGTPAAAPKPPARTANDVVLWAVYVPATDTAIATSQCVDMRVFRSNGPICIYRTTTTETTNTSATAIEILNKANSGVTIPNGLFTTGKVLRVRMGGNWLANDTTPTVRFVVAYGGVTMFSDISSATTNDTDRSAWWFNFDIVAQGNADQSVNGLQHTGQIAAKTAPTTGIGDVWATAIQNGAFSGTGTADSDAANRLLSVQATFSVSSANNEIVVEYATVEIL